MKIYTLIEQHFITYGDGSNDCDVNSWAFKTLNEATNDMIVKGQAFIDALLEDSDSYYSENDSSDTNWYIADCENDPQDWKKYQIVIEGL